VTIAVAGGIADVQLSRPDKLNAIDGEMFTALSEASAQVAATPGVRAVVLSGRGRAFCAGLDLGQLAADPGFLPASITERTHGAANLWQHAVWGWRELAVPVIAAVHGVAFGLPNPGLLPTKHEWDEQRESVRRAVARLRRKGITADGHVLGTRNATKKILAEAIAEDCDAIVMGGDADAGRLRGDFMWTQEPQRVRRKAKVPVFVVQDEG